MVNKNISTKILGVDIKTSKDGTKKYYWITVDQAGGMSCWNDAIANACKKYLQTQETVLIDYEESEGLNPMKTIRSLPKPFNVTTENIQENISNGGLNAAIEEGIKATSKEQPRISLKTTKLQAAKDIFICLYSAQQVMLNNSEMDKSQQELWTAEFIMDKAVSLVNQAELGFEIKDEATA